MKDIAKAIVFAGIFAIPFIVLFISNSLFFPFITGKNFAFRIIVEVIFAAWIILALYDVQYRPRFSWIIPSFLGLLGVMFVANHLGAHPATSFWSNFERMEGYVTLVHTFMYMIVLGSVMKTEKLWDRYFNTIISVAIILSLYAFAQLSGNIDIRQGGWRLDGTLGNSAYMAIYTLFLSFITLYMFLKTKSKGLKYGYGALMLLFVYLLIQTATRGTILGLVGGVFIMAVYVALFGKGSPALRSTAINGIIALLVIVGGFIAMKDTQFVQENRYLERVANISLSEATNRLNIWSMAFEGVKERPILGWGQGNYNFVFNEHFRPEMHRQEAWFDRVHNIAMDWLIAGGVLGLLAYVSILFSALYYVVVRPFIRKDDESFTVMEQGLLLGLLAGYVIHNTFVFDNIVSYIFYGTILAFIHSRVSTPITAVAEKKVDERIITQIVTPVVIVLFAGIVYVVNIPNIQAAGDVIKAFQTNDPNVMLSHFDKALSRNTFGKQEIREQLTQRGQTIVTSTQVPEEVRNRVAERIEQELLAQIDEKPGDARLHVFISAFYRTSGQFDKAREQLVISRELSPRKQLIIYEQGYTEIQSGNYEEALAFFKDAFELGPQFMDARVNYAIASIYAQELELFDELIVSEGEKRAFARSQLAIQAVYQAKMYPLLTEMFAIQIGEKPEDKQLRTSLAFVLNESGDPEGAIEVLKEAIEIIPSFESEANQFIESILLEMSGVVMQ